MSSQINKRKPPDRSPPPPVFSSFSFFSFSPRGLAMTSPEDKAVTKVTLARARSLGKHLSLVGWAEPRRGAVAPEARLTKWRQRIDGEATVSLTFSEMHQGVGRRRVPSWPPSPYSHPKRSRCKRCHIPARHCLICVKRRSGSDPNALCYSSREKGYRINPWEFHIHQPSSAPTGVARRSSPGEPATPRPYLDRERRRRSGPFALNAN